MAVAAKRHTIDVMELKRSILRDSFEEFVRAFWQEVPGAGTPVWGWHMSYICDEMQAVAERVRDLKPNDYDLIINIAPGTSKSMICSVLFHPWTWTFMPWARHINASHTDNLVLDLATKARDVIRSAKYQRYFPHVVLRKDLDAKGYYGNTAGGMRFSCTVGGKTPTGFHGHFQTVDDPIDPKKALSEVLLKAAEHFMTQVLPSRKTDKEVSSAVLIQQRVHHLDPTGVLLEIAKKEKSRKIRSVCLPARLTDSAGNKANVSPSVEELRQRHPEAYANPTGLMDPKRLSDAVLDDFLSKMSPAGFDGQFIQKPVPPGGQMFRPEYFNLRVKASPHDCVRVRYWDRASTQDGGCNTAGVLIAKDTKGNYYIEHVVKGQWEPRTRNQRIRACALRDRARYPNNEPKLFVEDEGGSSGKDAWQNVARALDGFSVVADKVTGDKITRAEGWSSQCAALNVYVVDDGTWDINDYVREHELFPMHELKDQVDASTGAYNILVGKTAGAGFQVRQGKLHGDRKKPCFFVMTKEDLQNTVDDRTALIVYFKDPLDDGMPGHGLKALDTLEVECVDLDPADYQDRYDDVIPQYGKGPGELHLTREQAKTIWKFLLKRRPENAMVYAFVDQNDRRAVSAAMAVCDCMGGVDPRKYLYHVTKPDNVVKGDAPNGHVYQILKTTRGSVV